MDALFRYADLISALFGLAAALVLGWPAVRSITAKRNWDQLARVEKQAVEEAETARALRGIRRHVERGQLGDARAAAAINLIGFFLLTMSFLFLAIASIGRLQGT